jgi:hypothetical protein
MRVLSRQKMPVARSSSKASRRFSSVTFMVKVRTEASPSISIIFEQSLTSVASPFWLRMRVS